MTDEAYPLDEVTIGMIAELREQQKNAQLALNTILAYFARLHKLEGNWQLAPNERELARSGALGVPLPDNGLKNLPVNFS